MARTTKRAPSRRRLRELFTNVRKNYFTLYAHYVYFDVVRYLYIQADAVFATFILVPTVAVGKITLGVFQQIVSAFTQVASSFQYLVNSWPTIVELISIYKRLRAFEATLEGAPLPEIDRHYLERERAGVRRRISRRLKRLTMQRRSSAAGACASAARLARPRRQIVAVARADHIGLDADLFGEALQRSPVGAVIHQREVEAELQRNALALILRVERGAERLVANAPGRPRPRPAVRNRPSDARTDCSPWR